MFNQTVMMRNGKQIKVGTMLIMWGVDLILTATIFFFVGYMFAK